MGGLVPSAQPAGPRRLEQGLADADPLSGEGRLIPTDLRAPTGFESVYEISKRDAFGREQMYFYRQSGAMTAVFPRSTYTPMGVGLMAELPAGTVFLIGSDPEKFGYARVAPPVRPKAANAIDLSMKLAVPDEPIPEGDPKKTVPAVRRPSIWTSEAQRREQVGALMGRIGRQTPGQSR